MSLVYSHRLPLGWQATEFKLSDVDGTDYSLKDFSKKQGLMIVFTCNHCPYAQASWPVLVDLYDVYKDDIDFVAINSNDDKEYPQDGLEGMKELVKEFGVEFPYLRDKTQKVAKEYQAQCTPDVYLFKNMGNSKFELQYHGRINDNWQDPDQVDDHSLQNALEKLVNDDEPILDQYPSMGCSIKYKD